MMPTIRMILIYRHKTAAPIIAEAIAEEIAEEIADAIA